MEDTLTIATAEGVRIYAITTKNLVQEAAPPSYKPFGNGRARQGHERRFNACCNNERRRTYSFKT